MILCRAGRLIFFVCFGNSNVDQLRLPGELSSFKIFRTYFSKTLWKFDWKNIHQNFKDKFSKIGKLNILSSVY